jgi:hypothetical protein
VHEECQNGNAGCFSKKAVCNIEKPGPRFFPKRHSGGAFKISGSSYFEKIGIECFKNLYTAGSGKGGRARGHDG